MPIRLIDVFLPERHEELVESSAADDSVLGSWREKQADGVVHVQMLVKTEHAESVLDDLEQSLVGVKDYRVLMLPVVASIPRLEAAPEEEAGAKAPEEKKRPSRVSREEVYAQIGKTVELSGVYVVLVVLSAVVAAIGLSRNSPAVVIAAMVIAPMLGPHMALALSVTLADFSLGAKALKAAGVGIAAALLFSILAGMVFRPTLGGAGITLGDVALALASGAAGALAFTTSAATWLVGVMVAVALLPPLVACGMLAGQGQWAGSGGALMLFVTNVICVNLAAVATFVAQGIRPRTWWKANKARRASRIALLVWGGMLLLLVVLILVWGRG